MASSKRTVDVDASSSRSSTVVDLDSLRKANFDGKIPVKLVLAQTSLSSGVPPQPQHVLVSRQTFLHVGLESAVRKLHEHALPTLSFLGGGNRKNVVVVQEDDDDDDDDVRKAADQGSRGETSQKESSKSKENTRESDSDKPDTENEESSSTKDTTPPYPICWFEDVATGQPLRWQYFCGVLFDSLHCTNFDLQNQPLPWEIRLHFRSYPSQQLLELCDPSWGNNGGVLDTLRQTFRNSLKQAFVIRYGNSKEALNLSKQAHDSIWEGISIQSFDGIASVVHRDDEFVEQETPAAASQNNTTTDTTKESTETDEKDEIVAEQVSDNDTPDATGSNSPKESTTKANNLVMLPIRLSVDPTKPMLQKRFEGGQTVSTATLGTLLLEWVPSHFESITNDSIEVVQPKSDEVSWRVAGLAPPLSTPLLDLWLALKHPDNFLYISLSIPKQ